MFLWKEEDQKYCETNKEVIDLISESLQNQSMKKTNKYSHIKWNMHILRNSIPNDSRLKDNYFCTSLFFLKGIEAVLHISYCIFQPSKTSPY